MIHHHPNSEGGSITRAASDLTASDAVTLQPSPITVCAGCHKTSTRPGVWSINPQPSTLNLASHGLCPDCVNTYAQSHPISEALRTARILRTMVQGNLDMAARLIQIGDPGMASAELNQALSKIDQLLNSLAE